MPKKHTNSMVRRIIVKFKMFWRRVWFGKEVAPVQKREDVKPHGSKWRWKGRTKGAFGKCHYLKRKDSIATLTIGKPDAEYLRKQRQRRRKIRRLIERAS